MYLCVFITNNRDDKPVNNLGSPSEKDLVDGLIITIFEDEGPVNVFNSSPLSEDEAFSHSIKSLTAIGYDVPIESNEIHSYGPMPTPREKYQSYGFVFVIKAVKTSDPRIARIGRIVVFWIITKSKSAMRYIGVIKRMIKRILILYSIKTDQDLKNEEITKKIKDRLQIDETGIELYYIAEDGKIDPFSHISMIPSIAPIVYLDRPNKLIKLLLRARKTQPSQKVELLQLINEYKKSLTKGSMYRAEIVTDSFAIQTLLSRAGIEPQQDDGMYFRFRAFDSEISFEDLDDFFLSHITPRKQHLIGQILRSIQEKTHLDLNELSIESGISIELIEEFIISAIDTGLIKKARIENKMLYFEK